MQPPCCTKNPGQERVSTRLLSANDGQRRCANHAYLTHDKHTCLHKCYKPSPSRGHSWSRGWNWSGASEKSPQATLTSKFTQWIEARPITNVGSEEAVEFFLDILHRFGVPNTIIIENGTQFPGKKFHKFCYDYHTQVYWATMTHPCTNGQVERANDMIL